MRMAPARRHRACRGQGDAHRAGGTGSRGAPHSSSAGRACSFRGSPRRSSSNSRYVRRRAFSIESQHDDVHRALPRAQGEALPAAADDGLKVILGLEMVRATNKLEHAIDKLGAALSRRAATISADFDRVEAAALDRAAEIGVRLHAPFALKWDWTPARTALDKLQSAISCGLGRSGMQRALVIALAERHAPPAQDVVSGDGVEMEVGQRKREDEGLRREGEPPRS